MYLVRTGINITKYIAKDEKKKKQRYYGNVIIKTIFFCKGLDIGLRGYQDVCKQMGIPEDYDIRTLGGERFCPIGLKIASKGRFGRKTGKPYVNTFYKITADAICSKCLAVTKE